MDLSYQEKSIWDRCWPWWRFTDRTSRKRFVIWGNPSSTAGTLGRLMATVIVIVVIEIVYHIVLASVIRAHQPKDERDL